MSYSPFRKWPKTFLFGLAVEPKRGANFPFNCDLEMVLLTINYLKWPRIMEITSQALQKVAKKRLIEESLDDCH